MAYSRSRFFFLKQKVKLFFYVMFGSLEEEKSKREEINREESRRKLLPFTLFGCF